MEKKIQLVVAPEIKHSLEEVGKQIDERISVLELNKMVATEDNYKSLKVLRADLNREFKEYNEQLKFVKDAVSAPYVLLQASYKLNITEKYTPAIELIKTKVDFVEDDLKNQKKEAVQTYFNELVASEKITFLKFEDLNLTINLTVSLKKLKEAVNAFVTKVVDDLLLIENQPNQARILVEYKKDLNASKAITKITADITAENAELERIAAVEWTRRKNEFKHIGMAYDEETKAFIYDDEIYTPDVMVRDIDRKSFTKKIAEVTELINDKKALLLDIEKKSIIIPPQTQGNEVQDAIQIYRQGEMHKLGLAFDGQSFIYQDINFHYTDLLGMTGPQFAKALEGAKLRMEQLKAEVAPIIQAPQETAKAPEQLEISFKVTGSLPQLRALKAYMIEKKLTFESLD